MDGFTGSRHKKFSDYMSAAEYVKTGAESSKYEYYGVRKGRSTGVYTSHNIGEGLLNYTLLQSTAVATAVSSSSISSIHRVASSKN